MVKICTITWILGLLLVVGLFFTGCSGTGDARRVLSNNFYLSAPRSVALGNTAIIQVAASNIQNVYGFQFEIQYDSTYFDFVSMTEGAQLTQFGFPSSVFCVEKDTTVSGKISKIACTKTGKVAGMSLNGTLYTLTLRAKAKGTSSVTILNPKVVNPEILEVPVTSTGANIKIA